MWRRQRPCLSAQPYLDYSFFLVCSYRLSREAKGRSRAELMLPHYAIRLSISMFRIYTTRYLYLESHCLSTRTSVTIYSTSLGPVAINPSNC